MFLSATPISPSRLPHLANFSSILLMQVSTRIQAERSQCSWRLAARGVETFHRGCCFEQLSLRCERGGCSSSILLACLFSRASALLFPFTENVCVPLLGRSLSYLAHPSSSLPFPRNLDKPQSSATANWRDWQTRRHKLEPPYRTRRCERQGMRDFASLFAFLSASLFFHPRLIYPNSILPLTLSLLLPSPCSRAFTPASTPERYHLLLCLCFPPRLSVLPLVLSSNVHCLMMCAC